MPSLSVVTFPVSYQQKRNWHHSYGQRRVWEQRHLSTGAAPLPESGQEVDVFQLHFLNLV